MTEGTDGISNKVLVVFWLEEGCSQEEGEVQISWAPINFLIYDKLFVDMIYEAADEWLLKNKLQTEILHEVIFCHERDIDAGGACLGEWFYPLMESHARTS